MSAGRVSAPVTSPETTTPDPSWGERLAQHWVAEHRPGRRVVRVRVHSVLHRAVGDVSARVDVVLDGDGDGDGHGDGVTLLVHDREGSRSVSAFPDDPALPTLAAVIRGGSLEPMLREAGLGRDWGAGQFGYETDVVHHPREGACVLRVRVGEGEAYAKVYPRPDDATAAAERAYAVGADRLVTSRGVVVRLPRVLSVSAPLHTVVLESLTAPGSSAPRTRERLPLSVKDVAGALRALHGHRPAGRLPVVTAREHVHRVVREQELVGTMWPALAQRVDDVIRAAALALDDQERNGGGAGNGAPVLCHGDFTPGQLVTLDEGVGLLDLDTVSLGDPASDVGRFLAYGQVRAARLDPAATPAEGARARFLTAYGSPTDEDGATALALRVEAHRRLNLVMIALRAARRRKDARSALALQLLDADDPTPGRLP